MKYILIIIIIIISYAESNGQQVLQTSVPNIIEISFLGTSSASGNVVDLNFNTLASYNTGAISAVEELRINSNNKFNISVKTNNSNFAYNGSEITKTKMPANRLAVSVVSNGTGGAVGSGFGNQTYKALSTSSASLITNGAAGPDKAFSVRYKATPGFNYAGGVYTIDVVFTATQP